MAVVILLSIATCVSLVTIVFGCLVCRRKLSDQEIQRKAFEKFRKRHMLYRDRILSDRVDYVRSVSEGKSSSCVSNVSDHTYEEMSTPPVPHPPIIQVQEPSPLHSSDYSFFDDSFQTVIEASSSNSLSSSSGTTNLLVKPIDHQTGTTNLLVKPIDHQTGTTNLLVKPMDHQASYISLRHGNSQACLRSGDEEEVFESEGEVNPCFSDITDSSADNVGSVDSLNDSYIVPSCGPKIKIIQPSVKRNFNLSVPLTNVQANVSSKLPLPVRKTEVNTSDPRNSMTYFSDCTGPEVDIRDSNRLDKSCDTESMGRDYHGDQHIRHKSLQKLENSSSLDSRNESSNYEKLQSSTSDYTMYKSLHKTALVLPGRPRMFSPMTSLGSHEANSERSRSCSPGRSRQISTTSRCSDHTYESINSILACEVNKRDSVASVEQDSGAFNITSETTVHTRDLNTQNDLSTTSPDHTYESIKSRVQSVLEKSEIACENSAVIIGRRVSNPFDSNKISKRMINKKKQKNMKNNVNQPEKKVPKDSEERYSPFPSTKKLAFKSAFKQVSSPRFSVIQTVTGNMRSQLVFTPEICPDNLNIKTPEIKVDNCSQFFDNTSFISPKVLNACTNCSGDEGQKDTIDFISPMHTYLTLKDCMSLKISDTNLQTSLTEKRLNYRKSLPSLSDHLAEDIVKHCSINVYSRSTPCELDQSNCNFF